MPQLDPSPWIFILVLVWLVFLGIILPKIVNQEFPNNTETQNVTKSKKQP